MCGKWDITIDKNINVSAAFYNKSGQFQASVCNYIIDKHNSSETFTGDMWIGYFNYMFWTFNGALKFDCSEYIKNRTIKTAMLVIKGKEAWPMTIIAYAFTTDWQADSLTWDNAPDIYASPYCSGSGETTVEIDVKSIVTRWANGSWNNFGIRLKSDDPYKQFESSAEDIPILLIELE